MTACWQQLLARHHTTWGPLLHVVFPFDELPSPDVQDKAHFEELRQRLLGEFAAAVEEGAAGVWRDEDRRALTTAVDQIARAELYVHADYGCVVVAHTRIGCWGEESTTLEVIGLDQHTFALHSSNTNTSSESGRQFTSTTGAPARLVAGAVPRGAVPRLKELVDQLLAQKVPKHLRSANGKSGESARPRSSSRSTPTSHALSAVAVHRISPSKPAT
jgi:hypothetical protein